MKGLYGSSIISSCFNVSRAADKDTAERKVKISDPGTIKWDEVHETPKNPGKTSVQSYQSIYNGSG